MGRHLDSVCKLCRREGIKLYLKGTRCDSPKCAFERQFRRYFEIASRSPENTGEVLLSIMERRLDNIVHRLGFAPNRASARQLVTHGHVQVNGRKASIPSMLL